MTELEEKYLKHLACRVVDVCKKIDISYKDIEDDLLTIIFSKVSETEAKDIALSLAFVLPEEEENNND